MREKEQEKDNERKERIKERKQKKRNSSPARRFLEDLFLGSQWSIILGYRRLSVKFPVRER